MWSAQTASTASPWPARCVPTAIDTANADARLAVATLDQTPTAQADYDTAIQQADDRRALLEASGDLTWTTTVASDEYDLNTEYATQLKDTTTSLAGLDKTGNVDMAGHDSAERNADAADRTDFWNQQETAVSDRYMSEAVAYSDFRLADLTAQATVLDTINAAIATPWTQFNADRADAEVGWWASIQTDYLAYVANVNAAHEANISAVGVEYVNLGPNPTPSPPPTPNSSPPKPKPSSPKRKPNKTPAPPSPGWPPPPARTPPLRCKLPATTGPPSQTLLQHRPYKSGGRFLT